MTYTNRDTGQNIGIVKPIETQFDGYRFRSRLEARWAVFFRSLGLTYEYEKEGYDLGDGLCYLPDFWLPTVSLRDRPFHKPIVNGQDEFGYTIINGKDEFGNDVTYHAFDKLGIWVEIKGDYPTKEEEQKCYRLAEQTGHAVILFVGLPTSLDDRQAGSSGRATDNGYEFSDGWDNCMSFMQCHICGTVKVEFAESNYMQCPRCGTKCDDHSPNLHLAYNAARMARFEFGAMP